MTAHPFHGICVVQLLAAVLAREKDGRTRCRDPRGNSAAHSPHSRRITALRPYYSRGPRRLSGTVDYVQTRR